MIAFLYRLLRGLARSHRYGAVLEGCGDSVGAGKPAKRPMQVYWALNACPFTPVLSGPIRYRYTGMISSGSGLFCGFSPG
ncbi:MAG: hypothetical protein E2580_03045 [Pseudomonas sp.]|nr:hypothetical protein [Pseudomonas sp.]TRO30688.1 hypothetical protein EQ845_26055 [Pseudomonas putida]